MVEANHRALKAGYHYGETTEIFHTHYHVPKAQLQPGRYRNITGNEATALGFVAASRLADRPLFYGAYPITPASDILHQLVGLQALRRQDLPGRGRDRGHRRGHRRQLRRRDGHDRHVSGPGIALKSEAIGLAVMVELPLVVIDVQRAGPSTGMPTKTEQADLLQVLFGRNSECADAGRGTGHAGRLLRRGHRGLAHRADAT